MPTPPQIHLGRRWMLASSTLLALPGTALARLTAQPGASAPAPHPLSSGSMPPELPAILAAIEARHGGRLGLSVSHLPSGETWGWRASERFEPCSTYKALLAAWVLKCRDQGRPVPDLLLPRKPRAGHSPFSQAHAGQRVSALQLAQAMTEESDNEAARTVLAHLGGTAVLERFARDLGNPRFVFPGDPHLDPAMPASAVSVDALGMQVAMARLATSDELLPASRTLWLRWLRRSQTGMRRLRAGWPARWLAGSKTGSGEGQSHDLALVMKAHHPEQVVFSVAAYWQSTASAEQLPPNDFERREQALREVAAAMSGWMRGKDAL